MRRIALGLAASLIAFAVQAQLSDTEQKIVAAVKARTPQALALLQKSVMVNSGTLNLEGVREVGAIYRAEFDALGFKTRWIDMPPGMHRAGHLVATLDGNRGQRLLLLGHLDTVFEKNSKVTAWDPQGARVRGQGVGDMKGGDVIMIEALRALKTVGVLDGARIAVMLTGDEERTGNPVEQARADMVTLARQSDLALSFEGAAKRGAGHGASIARRSSGGWVVQVTAKPGHSSRVFSPELGYGAIYEAARIMNAFREQLQEKDLTYNVGLAYGGTDTEYEDTTASAKAFGKTNVIPRTATVRGDLRYLTPEQGARVKQRMRDIVAASLPGTSARISFSDAYPPMPPTEAGEKLLRDYGRASEDAGLGPIVAVDPSDRGAGDVQFVAPFIPGIDGLGATGSGAHTDDEDLEIASIERGAIRAAIYIYRLTRP